MKRKWIIIAAAIAVAVVAVVLIVCLCGRNKSHALPAEEAAEEETVELLFGIDKQRYDIEQGIVREGETAGQILARYGVGAGTIDRIAKAAESVFSLKNIRFGKPFTVFREKDSTSRLAYFVYEPTATDYLIVDLSGDSVDVRKNAKEVTVERRMKTATIESSLWNCMIDNGMSPNLAMELSEIYAWSIDFFGLQKGNNFTIIYDQQFVDSTEVGHGTIWGARFEHGGKTYYAVPFVQDGKLSYWDEQGNSLRKNLLKAPLKYSRISSRFSNGRMHPILRIRRPHHGVDYAAPSGTPVVAVGDGVVIFKGYAGGGGNTLKIKHNSGSLVSGYLHLKGYAKGIAKGTRVRQGQLIGYVGSTGLSTGPHLDFRLWRNGTPIDPLKVPTEPAEPIREANRAAFTDIKDRILAELQGRLADSLRVTTFEQTPDTAARTAKTDSVPQK